jgi:hypothetical protein
VSANAYETYREFVTRASTWDGIGLAPRVVRSNVLPPLVLLIVAAGAIAAYNFAARPLLRVLRILTCGLLCRQQEKIHGNPPFTEGRQTRVRHLAEYYIMLPLGSDEHSIS